MTVYKHIVALALTGAFLPAIAQAQTDAPSFSGPHVTIMAGWNQGQVKDGAAGLPDRKKSSVNVRGAAGYDVPIGNMAIIGAELGIGTGGRDVVSRSGTSTYTSNPGITLDATARVGIKPTSGLLLFGKGGWAFQRVRTTLDTNTADLSRKNGEHGFLWGGGAEVALTRNVALRADFDRVSFNDHYKRNRVLAGVNVRF
ncbi:outer membrane protein [Novosphingobium sp. ZW T3_23]|uniref:outer membrane protein n=1 Tax=Novosphingobium sp. ZW T3_23 TaxID=3378084 RepID=UPI003851EAA5